MEFASSIWILSLLSECVMISIYRQTYSIRRTNPKTCFLSRLVVAFAKSIEVWNWEWICSFNNADRRCSNYTWVINKLISYLCVVYIRGLMVYHDKRDFERDGFINNDDCLCTKFMQGLCEQVMLSMHIAIWGGKTLLSADSPWVCPTND